MKMKALRLFAAFIVIFAGCASVTEEHRGAAIGAGLGAGAGAVTGAVIDEGPGGAIVGGLIGALVGGAIGHYAYDVPRDREETARAYDYNYGQPPILKIEDIAVYPKTVHAGDTVNLNMTYAVLTPYAGTKTLITELREITYYGELVGNPEVRVEHFDGTYTSSVPLHLPPQAGRGEYKVRFTVFSNYGRDVRETSFVVR